MDGRTDGRERYTTRICTGDYVGSWRGSKTNLRFAAIRSRRPTQGQRMRRSIAVLVLRSKTFENEEREGKTGKHHPGDTGTTQHKSAIVEEWSCETNSH